MLIRAASAEELPMTLHDVALDDKFDLGKQRIFLSGSQAVIRMLLMQR